MNVVHRDLTRVLHRPTAMYLALRLLLCCSALWTASVPASEAVARIDLDALAAEPRPEGNAVRVIEPRDIEAEARIKTLPARGKTQYLLDTLSLQGASPLPEVHFKMLLLSPKGEELMAYVEDRAAAHIARSFKPGDAFVFQGKHLWVSRHGPGIFITGFPPRRDGDHQ